MRRWIRSFLFTVACLAAMPVEKAWADEPSGEPAAGYTLEIDSDAPDVVSFEALAASVAADLGSPVVRPSATATPTRARIVMRYRGGQLMVRAEHMNGPMLERTVTPRGDAYAVQREAVLLASNLARDEAREIIDALSAKNATATPPPPPPPPVAQKKIEPKPEDGEMPVTVGLAYPLAMNYGRAHVLTYVDLSFLFGHVGTVHGAQLSGAVSFATRRIEGGQITGIGGYIGDGGLGGVALAGFGTLSIGEMNGAMVAGATNVVLKDASGLLLAGGANVVTGKVTGAEISTVNVAEDVDGAQISVVNVGRKVTGLQLGVVNVAEEVDGAAIGLVSISKNSVHPIVWGSTLDYVNVGVKFTNEYVYTLVAFSYGSNETNLDPTLGSSAAIGGHIPIGAFDVEPEVMITSISPEKPKNSQNTWLQGHVNAGYAFASHLRVFAGGGVRAPLSVDVGRSVVRPEVLAGVQF